MPYSANADLPPAVRSRYSERCQTVFRSTWNADFANHSDETRAFRIAHTAARNCMNSVKAAWSSSYVTDLPDSAFACIDSSGRHYPHHDANGKLDLPHLRNALSRLGQSDTTSCGASHLRAHAKAEGIGEAKALKASLVDEEHFKLLAIPFGGPIKGRDVDGEYFSKRTDIKPDWFSSRPVLWHHGADAVMGDDVIGKATDLTEDEDGWWVDVWVEHGQKRSDLIKRLANRVPLYGSSGTIGYLKKAAPSGEILTWPYVEQTLTTSPQNSYSVLRAAKAVLEDFDSAEIPLDRAVKAWLGDLDALGADLTLTSGGSEAVAKAGRVLSAANERRLRDALAALSETLEEMAIASNPPAD